MVELNEVSRGLGKANQKSKRKGHWSSVSETQRETDEKVTLNRMRELVRRGDAVEKKKGSTLLRLFRKGGGGGGGGGISGITPPRDYKSPDPYDNYPDGQDRRGGKPDAGDQTGDTIRRGIGIAIVGGMPGGTPAAAPRGGTIMQPY